MHNFRASVPLSLGLELEWSVRRRRGQPTKASAGRRRRSVFTKGGGGFQGRTWPGQKRKEGAPPLLHFLKARRRGGGEKMEKRNSGKRSLEQWLLELPRPVEEGDSWSEGIGFCSAFSLPPPFQSPFFYIGCGNSTAGNGGNKILFLSALFLEWPRAGVVRGAKGPEKNLLIWCQMAARFSEKELEGDFPSVFQK